MPQGASTGVNILQNVPQPQPFGTLQNMQALGQMADQEQAKVQSQRAQAELQRVMQQYANDPDEGVNELLRRGFVKESQALDKHLGEVRSAKLKERGLHLDNLHKEGTINEQMYKLEKAAIESDDPMDALRMIAHAGDQAQLDEARSLVSFKYGPKAPHLLKVIPSQWTPDLQERVSQMVLGPVKMSDMEDKGLARDQTWDLAAIDDARADAQMAQTGAYQNRMATVAERNAGSNALRARQAGTGGGGGGVSGGAGSAALPPQAQSVLARVLTGMPGTRVGLIRQEVSRLAGDEAALKSYLRYAATQKVGETRQTAMQGRMETLAALKDAEELLQQVPTGFIRGTWENTARVLGKTSDPRLVELGTRMGTILAHYMRSISGAAVSDNEAARLTPLIPNYKNDLSVNLGTIKGFSEAIKSFDKAFYQNTFGENYDWVMGSGPSASSGQKSGGTQEGATKPITTPGYPPGAMQQFKNGQWVRIK